MNRKRTLQIVGLSLVLIASYWLYQQSRDPLSSEEIHALIEQGETEIDLTELTDLEWTTAGIYGPYTRGKDIKQDMSIASPFFTYWYRRA